MIKNGIHGTLKWAEEPNFYTRVSPTVEICLSESGERIIGEHKEYRKFIYSDANTGKTLFFSRSPSWKESGFIGWLKNIHFYQQSNKIAEIRYFSLFDRAHLFVNDEEIVLISKEIMTSQGKLTGRYLYKTEMFEMLMSFPFEESSFTVWDNSFLYPCIGFLNYFLWASSL